MNKQMIRAITTGTLLSISMTAPVVLADNHAGTETTMEQRADTAERAIKDAWLDGKLESALLLNGYLNSFDIDTEVSGGVAYLSGTVESDIDRDLAGEIAKSINGVTDVKNALMVDKTKAMTARDADDAETSRGFKKSISNATLTARIKTELLLNSNTAGLSINVDSKDGMVVLSGEVDSEQEKQLAEKIADNATGAESVNNLLTVKTDG